MQAVLAQGQLLEYGPGDVVFRQGDQGDRLFIVKSGVLEILAAPADGADPMPVAYLGTGEVLGELALLTGSPRSATVRSPERAELFAIEKAVFLDLMDVLPAFARNLCVVLAKRLEATTLKVPRASGKQLQGNLRYFDLATVIQTLIGSHQTGTLVVSQDKATADRRDLLLPGEHRPGEVPAARRRRRRVPALPERRSKASSRSPAARSQEDEVQIDITHARDLAAHGVGAPAGRAAAAQGEAPRPRAGLPPARRPTSSGRTRTRSSSRPRCGRGSRRGRRLNDLQRDVPRCSYAIYKTVSLLARLGPDRVAGRPRLATASWPPQRGRLP